MRTTEYTWGDTCPLLKVARHFQVDYLVPLALADYWLHNRQVPLEALLLLEVMALETRVALFDAIRSVADRFDRLQAGVDTL